MNLICISCPMGCALEVTQTGEGEIRVTGNTCKRGEIYGKQEFICPMRTVTSSVRCEGGTRTLCSVKTASPVPRDAIPDVLKALRTIHAAAPIMIGDVLCADIAGTGVALVATSNLAAR